MLMLDMILNGMTLKSINLFINNDMTIEFDCNIIFSSSTIVLLEKITNYKLNSYLFCLEFLFLIIYLYINNFFK